MVSEVSDLDGLHPWTPGDSRRAPWRPEDCVLTQVGSAIARGPERRAQLSPNSVLPCLELPCSAQAPAAVRTKRPPRTLALALPSHPRASLRMSGVQTDKPSTFSAFPIRLGTWRPLGRPRTTLRSAFGSGCPGAGGICVLCASSVTFSPRVCAFGPVRCGFLPFPTVLMPPSNPGGKKTGCRARLSTTRTGRRHQDCWEEGSPSGSSGCLREGGTPLGVSPRLGWVLQAGRFVGLAPAPVLTALLDRKASVIRRPL